MTYGHSILLVCLVTVTIMLSATAQGTVQRGNASSPTDADIMVYVDDLQAPWFHITYNSTVTVVSTEQAHAGTASMKVSAIPWGWVSMHYGPWNTQGFSPGPYKSVEFAIYPTSAATSVAVFLENDQGQSFPKVPKGTFTANAWTIVSVPMSELNPNNQMVGRIFVQEFTGNTKTFYLDDFRFVAAIASPNAPLLTSPVNGATGVAEEPTLTWNASAGAESYHLQVSTNSSFSTTAFDQSDITGTSAQVSRLSSGASYYWRVNAKNAGGSSAWSSTWTFRTVLVRPAAPSLVAPVDRASNQPTTLIVDWNSVTGAASYQVQVSTTSSFTTTFVDEASITTTSRQVSGLSANTQYFWRVNAQNSGGVSDWSAVWSFSTAAETPSAPTLSSPPDGASNQPTTLTLRWNLVLGALSYRLQVSTTSSFTTTVADETSLLSTAKQVTGLSPNTQYFWRVNAQGVGGTSDWSSIWSFTTVGVSLQLPSLLSPPNGATNQPTSLTLQWNSVTGATAYQVQVSTSSSFATTVVDDSSISGTSRVVSTLARNTRYYWRVNARNTSDASGWSAIWSFTTLPADTTGTLSLNTTIDFPQRNNPTEHSQGDYKIVGLPGASNAPVASYLPGTPGVDWQLYWDNGASTDYMIPYKAGAEFVFSAGRAFWMIKNGPWTINFTVPVVTLNASKEAELPLHKGWNLITNPFLTPVSWSIVQALNSQDDSLYKFENGTFSFSDTLTPFMGYYFFNAADAEKLRVPSTGSSSQLITHRKASMDLSNKQTLPGEWLVNVVLRSGSFTDRTLWFGIAQDAQSGWDSRDVHKPRGMHTMPMTFFQRPEWDTEYSSFATDIRPPGYTIEDWQFEVQALPGQPTQLLFKNIESVPLELAIRLVDDVSGTSLDLRTEQPYSFLPMERVRKLTVLVGKPEEIADRLPRGPSEFSLGANYPNPFNPTTTIPFVLPATAAVHITVHDVLGQEIKSLLSAPLNAGRHSIQWDGTDNAGALAPSGVYFYRFTTTKLLGGSRRIITRSMILIK